MIQNGQRIEEKRLKVEQKNDPNRSKLNKKMIQKGQKIEQKTVKKLIQN